MVPNTSNTTGYGNFGQLVMGKNRIFNTGYTIGYDHTLQFVDNKSTHPNMGDIVRNVHMDQFVALESIVPNTGHVAWRDESNLGQLLFLKSFIANSGHRIGGRAMNHCWGNGHPASRNGIACCRYRMGGYRIDLVCYIVSNERAAGHRNFRDGLEAFPLGIVLVAPQGTARHYQVYLVTVSKGICSQRWRNASLYKHCIKSWVAIKSPGIDTGHIAWYGHFSQFVYRKSTVPDTGDTIRYGNLGQLVILENTLSDIGEIAWRAESNLGQIVVLKSILPNTGHTAWYGHTGQILPPKSILPNTGHRIGVRTIIHCLGNGHYVTSRSVIACCRYRIGGYRCNFVCYIIGNERAPYLRNFRNGFEVRPPII